MPFNVDELTRAKLCLLYLYRSVDVPLSRDTSIIAISVLAWIDQFTFSEALSDLVEHDLVLESRNQAKPAYVISPAGRETLAHFEKEIPLSMRNELDGIRDDIRFKARKESEYITDYYRVDEGSFLAELSIVEHGHTIFKVEVELASSAQADAVCKAWQETASKAYTAILSPITSHKG